MQLILIVLQIIAAMLSAYLIFYAREKGKNQANKNDLEYLTKIVEDIKKENTREIELLKANLLVLTDKEKQIFNEEKESIIIFFAQLNTWIWDSLNVYIYEYNHLNYQDITSKLIIMRDNYNKTNVTFSKVKLIVGDDNLIALGHTTIIDTLKLHHFVEGTLKNLLFNLGWEKTLIDQLLNKEIDFHTLSNSMQNYNQNEAMTNKEERKTITDQYFKDQPEHFATAIKSITNFGVISRQYLRK